MSKVVVCRFGYMLTRCIVFVGCTGSTIVEIPLQKVGFGAVIGDYRLKVPIGDSCCVFRRVYDTAKPCRSCARLLQVEKMISQSTLGFNVVLPRGLSEGQSRHVQKLFFSQRIKPNNCTFLSIASRFMHHEPAYGCSLPSDQYDMEIGLQTR